MLEQKIEIVFANEFTSHLILSSCLVLPLHYQNSFCGCIFCNTSNQYFQGSFRRPFDRITEYLLEKKISNHLLLLILNLFGNAKMMPQSSLTKVCKLSLSSCVTSSTLVLLQIKYLAITHFTLIFGSILIVSNNRVETRDHRPMKLQKRIKYTINYKHNLHSTIYAYIPKSL